MTPQHSQYPRTDQYFRPILSQGKGVHLLVCHCKPSKARCQICYAPSSLRCILVSDLWLPRPYRQCLVLWSFRVRFDIERADQNTTDTADGGAPDWVKKGPRKAGRNSLLAAAVSDDGRYLAVGGGDKRVHVWDIRSHEYIQVRLQNELPVLERSWAVVGCMMHVVCFTACVPLGSIAAIRYASVC